MRPAAAAAAAGLYMRPFRFDAATTALDEAAETEEEAAAAAAAAANS